MIKLVSKNILNLMELALSNKFDKLCFLLSRQTVSEKAREIPQVALFLNLS